MPYINYDKQEIAFKIVYFGPGMSGKTTNLIKIHEILDPQKCSEMVVLDTEEERTLFFDFLPFDLGSICGFSVRFNMYTVPGQVQYEASRKLILDGADGVVFVADSHPSKREENLQSYQMMTDNFVSHGFDPVTYPLVIQFNKRDLDQVMDVFEMNALLNKGGHKTFEAVALKGHGVIETIKEISKQIVTRFEI